MKAHVRTDIKQAENGGGGGPFHGHELRLTVGLIVKNEEKNLGKCLSALEPLLEAVPSELIVTDTGSTDRTVEIARKYTDHVIRYEWNDDFSAARNTGLDEARGEWFLYLDADEWLDDAAPFIHFFNSGECDRYGSAAFAVRSYRNITGSSFRDDYVCRAFRISSGTRFRNKVHESVVLCFPMKMLNALAHHYGYAFRNEEERKKKRDRNEKMLEAELKANPDDKKALLQYSEQIVEDSPEKAAEYAERALAVEQRENPENRCHMQTRYVNALLTAYFNCHRYADIIPTAEKALKKEKTQNVYHLEFYRLCQIAAWQLKDYESAAKYGTLCVDLYPDYDSGKLDRSMLVYGTFPFVIPGERDKSLVMSGQAYLRLGKLKEARKCLESLDLAAEGSMRNDSLPFCTDLAAKEEDWGVAVEFYRRVLALGDEGKTAALLAHLNACYLNFPSRRRAMALAFAEAEGDGGWLLLCRLRAAVQENDRARAAAAFDALCRKGGEWGAGFADVFWYAVNEKKNLVPLLSHVVVDEFPAVATAMQAEHEDYSAVLAGFFEAFSFESAKALFCSVCLLERAVLSRNAKETPERYRKLADAYLENISKFVRAVYKPEVLTESGLSVLPHGARFGYYVGLALDAKRVGDGAAYLENLRRGLKEKPAMKDCVGFLLKNFEEEQKKSDAKAEEFSALAKQVKRDIERLIAQGDLKQAGDYTLQLAKLIPEDDDMRRYRRLTRTEPTMAELTSRLPQ